MKKRSNDNLLCTILNTIPKQYIKRFLKLKKKEIAKNGMKAK